MHLTFIKQVFKVGLYMFPGSAKEGSALLFTILFVVVVLFTAVASLSLTNRQSLMDRSNAQIFIHKSPTPILPTLRPDNCISVGACCNNGRSCEFDGKYTWTCTGETCLPPWPETPAPTLLKRSCAVVGSCCSNGKLCVKGSTGNFCTGFSCKRK